MRFHCHYISKSWRWPFPPTDTTGDYRVLWGCTHNVGRLMLILFLGDIYQSKELTKKNVMMHYTSMWGWKRNWVDSFRQKTHRYASLWTLILQSSLPSPLPIPKLRSIIEVLIPELIFHELRRLNCLSKWLFVIDYSNKSKIEQARLYIEVPEKDMHFLSRKQQIFSEIWIADHHIFMF